MKESGWSVNGNWPATKIPAMKPHLPGVERLIPYLRKIDSNRIYSNFGPLALEFGERLARHFGMPERGAIVAASGTAALIGAILAIAGRASQDKPLAVVPAFTFIATASAVEACGYRVLLADVDPESFVLDPERVLAECALDRVGLVVPVGPFGRAVGQAAWTRFRDQTGIPVVIDGAACFEAATASPDSTLGDIPVAMSFHATKSFGVGEGGCVVTRDVDLALRVARALNFGCLGSRDCQSANTNGKLSEYQAAVGLAELDGWPEKSCALRSVAECYRSALEGMGLLDHRFLAAPEVASSYALFRCETGADALRVERALAESGVGTRRWYGGGLHRHTYYSGFEHEALTGTERLADTLVGLPTAPDLAASDIQFITATLAAALNVAVEAEMRG
jgi:dTDP-4-amino-4,6-dideoxygalactose transaminase